MRHFPKYRSYLFFLRPARYPRSTRAGRDSLGFRYLRESDSKRIVRLMKISALKNLVDLPIRDTFRQFPFEGIGLRSQSGVNARAVIEDGVNLTHR